MQPCFRVPQLQGDPLELELIDELDFASDRANLTLSLGPNDRSALPTLGSHIDIEAGYVGALMQVGTYVIENYHIDHHYKVRIQAASLDFTAAMKQPRHATFEQQSLAAIFSQLGQRHGLAVETCPSLAQNIPEHLTQANQSDIDFMYRTAQTAGVRMSAFIDRLVFTDFESLTSEPKPLAFNQCLSFQLRAQAKPHFAAVRAHYWDPDQPGVTQSLVYPNPQEPYYDLPGYYENAAKARAASEGAYRWRQTQPFALTLSLSGDLHWHAGQKLAFEHPGLAEATHLYYIQRVQHHFTAQGYRTQIEAC